MVRKIIRIIYINLIFPFINLFIRKDTYIFMSFMGIKAAGDPLAFYQHIREEDENAKCVWITNGSLSGFNHVMHENTEFTDLNSYKLVYHYARAKLAISNGFFPFLYWKNRGSCYIETWHASPQMKHGLLDSDLSIFERLFFIKYIKNTDLVIVGNDIFEKKFVRSSAMNYKGEVLRIGSLRSRSLFTDYKDSCLKEIIKIRGNRRIILYAPTYRDYNEDVLQNELNNLIELFIKEELDKEWLLLIRKHHLSKISCHDERVVDVSEIENTEMILSISDFLITDYSSIGFDFLTIGKQFIFYHFDIKEYSEHRKLYFIDAQNELGIYTVFDSASVIAAIKNYKSLLSLQCKIKIYGGKNPCSELYGKLKERNIL